MSVTVQASKHPLKAEWVYSDVEPGQSIYEIAGGAPVAAYINGREVPEAFHRLTQPKNGSTLILWPVPQDDEILRGVIQIGIAIGTVGVTSVFGPLAGAAFNYVANAALNKLIPPQQPDQPETPESFNRLESITGTSNKVASFKPIPRLYGLFRFFPPIPMTARPYTEIVGDDQYFRMLLCIGYGPLDVGGITVGSGYSKVTETSGIDSSAIRIGETDIDLFDEVEYEIGTPDQMTLYSDQIFESNPAFNLNDNGATGIRTTEPDTDEISIGVAGRLFSTNDKAKTRNGTVRFRIEYREVGQTSWITEEEDWVISSSKKETVRQGYRWRVPKNQYEVRLTRKSSSFSADNNKTSDFTWNALRSIRSVQPFAVEDTVCMALRIKATDQLNGRIEDLSVLATSVLDVYDGSQWTKQATNNPAWVFADIWSGTANRQPVGKDGLDGDALLEWANYCDQEGLEYNGVFDSSGTTLDRAQEVAGAGLASWQFTPDSKISVVRDVVQSVPKMVISPRNSFGFNYELSVPQIPDALRVQFVDDRTWENTERLVFDDGFDETNAELYETLQAKGVTNPDQAWKYGRYHIAQQRLRPERYNFNQDVQHLRYQRGDLLTLQHDVIAVGLGAGRIKEVVSDTEIVVDEVFADQGITNYGVKIQHQDGSVSVVGCTLGAGPTNNTVFLDSAITKTNPDDLVIFGELGKESVDVKVTEIQPQGDFQAQITCVPAAPEIEQAWDGEIPAFDPVLTEPVSPDKTTPRVPSISDIRSDESVLYADDDGSLKVRMVVSTELGAFPGWDQKTQLRFRPVGDTSFETLEPTRSSSISVTDVDEGIEYEVQVRGVKDGIFSFWSSPVTHTVTGKTNPPPDVQRLNVVQNGETVGFRWPPVPAPDIGGYEIKYGPRESVSWESGIKIAEETAGTVVTEADVPPGDYKFFIKAIDTTGNYSREPAEKDIVVKTDYLDRERTQHAPDWTTGRYSGMDKAGDALIVNNPDQGYYESDEIDVLFNAENLRVWAVADVADTSAEETINDGLIDGAITTATDDGLLTGAVVESTDYGLLGLSQPISDSLISYQIAYRNEGENWFDPNSVKVDEGFITGNVNLSDDYGRITQEVTSYVNDDTLVGWIEWTKGNIDARYVKHRVRIDNEGDDTARKILRSFLTVVDIPERIEKRQNQSVPVGGRTFNFNRRFHFVPAVVGSVESDNPLYPIRQSVSETSVTFKVRNENGDDVGADNFDYIATGA